jgi:putative nucleotidyltransferase with HDIG domain
MVRDIPAMPEVAQKVMHMLGDPRTTNTSLGQALSSDMSMASRVLQMANSPFFGTRQKISSVSQAIFILGHSALRSLIITVCTKGIFKNPGLMEKKIWEHSLGTAVGARLLAKKTGLMDADEAFLGGLLHDVGRMILAVVYRNEYQLIFEKFYNGRMANEMVLDAEKQEFGYDHAEIGSRVITKWRLPNVLGRVCRRHHVVNPQLLEQEENPNAVAIVGLANRMAHRLGLGGASPDDTFDIETTLFNKQLKIDAETVLVLMAEMMKNFEESEELFKI